jgi:hypothetical protein
VQFLLTVDGRKLRCNDFDTFKAGENEQKKIKTQIAKPIANIQNLSARGHLLLAI